MSGIVNLYGVKGVTSVRIPYTVDGVESVMSGRRLSGIHHLNS